MDAKVFLQKFTDLFKEIDETGLLWDDEPSYFLLYDQLNSMSKKISEEELSEGAKYFNSEASSLLKKIEAYKRDLSKCPKLTDNHINRIFSLNRIEFLLYQQINKIKDNMDSIHFLIADKLVQGALSAGINGPYHQLYLNELLNYQRLVQIVDNFSKTKPVLEKYGKTVSNSQKVLISEMKTQEVFKVAEKVLGEKPDEFLARFPEYRESILQHVK